jgi:hypothetical protein
MNISKIKDFFNNIPFKKAIFLGPVAYVIHQIEESVLGFPLWREEHLHLSQNLPIPLFFGILMAVYLLYILIHYFWSNEASAWVVLTAILAMQFHNGIYHFVGTIVFADYSPGLVTGLIIYVPISCFLFYKAYKEELINKTSGILALIYSGILFWSFEFLGNIIVLLAFITSAIILIVYYFKFQGDLQIN